MRRRRNLNLMPILKGKETLENWVIAQLKRKNKAQFKVIEAYEKYFNLRERWHSI